MFLTILSFSMVLVFMYLIMTRRLSAMVALILVPTIFAIIGGFARDMGPMMLDGILTITPVAVMLMFAILFFGVMIDAGLFDPLVRRIVDAAQGDPVKVVVGTSVLTLMVALDGDGATTYMVTVAALMPLYVRLRMNILVMVCIISLSTSVMNVLPWGGPAGRAASALQLDMSELFLPMIPAMVGSGLGVILLAYRLGLAERRRLGALQLPVQRSTVATSAAPAVSAVQVGAEGVVTVLDEGAGDPPGGTGGGGGGGDEPRGGRLDDPSSEEDVSAIRRPKLFWVNLALTILLMIGLLRGVLPLAALFMLGFAVALLINYPTLQEQKERITAHAGNVLAVSGLIFAAGIFTGILSGTGMVEAMANAAVAMIPDAMGPYMAIFAGLLSIPGTFFISYDAFYYGVLPVIAEAGATYGVDPVEIARASLIGAPVHALSPLVASTYLLIGLSKVELGDHQRFALVWAILLSLLTLVLLIATGAVPVLH